MNDVASIPMAIANIAIYLFSLAQCSDEIITLYLDKCLNLIIVFIPQTIILLLEEQNCVQLDMLVQQLLSLK